MENCFDNIVGYRGCNNTSDYLIEITDFAGLSTEFLESLRVKDLDTIVNLINSLNERAARKIEVAIMRGLKANKATTYCYAELQKPLLISDVANPSINLELNLYCCYLNVRLDNIVFYSPSVQDVTFTISTDFGVINTITQTMAIGKNIVNVNNIFEPQDGNITITHNAASYYVHLNQGCCTCNQGIDCNCASVIPSLENSAGMMINYSIYCNIDMFICENIEALKNAFIAAFGEQLIIEKSVSMRSNVYTETKTDSYNKMLDYYRTQFEEAISYAINTIDTDNCCFECDNGAIYTQFVNP